MNERVLKQPWAHWKHYTCRPIDRGKLNQSSMDHASLIPLQLTLIPGYLLIPSWSHQSWRLARYQCRSWDSRCGQKQKLFTKRSACDHSTMGTEVRSQRKRRSQSHMLNWRMFASRGRKMVGGGELRGETCWNVETDGFVDLYRILRRVDL